MTPPGDVPDRGPGTGRAAALVAVLLGLAAFAWFWPTLHHGLRSDDYLVVYYTDRLTGDVAWGRVFEEFVRPWFGAGELYRPLVSLSYGIELWLCPSPAGRHAVNVAFVAIAIAAAAATAATIAPRRQALAALVAGAVVLLHPASVETAGWISARVTSLQMAAGALACWFYARHLVHGRPLWPCLCFVAALLGKEGAVTLPVTLLAIDWLAAPDRPWAPRLRRLLPFAVVLAFYLAWRVVLLGRIGPAGDNGLAAANALHVAVRTLQLLAPPDGAGAIALWAAPLLAAALSPLAPRLGIAVLLVPAWFFLVLSPTQHIAAAAAVLHGRFVFDAVPPLGLVLGVAMALAGNRTMALLAGTGLVGWLAAMALCSQHWLCRYGDEDRVARATERALAAAAAEATPAAPLACTGLPYLPLFHQKLWGVLALRPFAERDLPVLGLPEFLVPDEKAPEFWNDAAPLHAIQAAGGTVAMFDGPALRFVALPRAAANRTELAASAAAPRDFTSPHALPGTGIAAFEVRLPVPARTVRLRLLDDLPDERAWGWQTHGPAAGTTWFVATHAMAPVLRQGFGAPFRGVQLEVDGGDPATGTVVAAHATLAVRPPATPVAGMARSREQLLALSRTPPGVLPLRLYLLLPTGVRHMDVPPGGAGMSPALQEHLRWALDLFAPLPVYWFWQTPPASGAEPWCSGLDWATAR